MRNELLEFLGNFVNYLIFVYIFTKTLNNSCFSIQDLYLSLIGLSASVFIFIVNLINKYNK